MRELLMQSARLGLASCPAEGSQSWLVPAGSGGLRWNCWTPEPGAAHLPPQVSGSASHTVNSLFVLLPHYFSSLSWKGRLGLPVKPSPRNDTPPSVNHSLNWGFGFKEPEVPFRVSAPGSAVHTHLPAYLEIHVFAVRLFFFLSLPLRALRQLSGSDKHGNLGESRRRNMPLKRLSPASDRFARWQRHRKHCGWQSALAKKTRVGFPGIAGCFIPTWCITSCLPLTASPQQIGESACKRNGAFPKQRTSSAVVSCGVSVLFNLQQQVKCFLDFSPSLTLIANPLNLRNTSEYRRAWPLFRLSQRKSLNITEKGQIWIDLHWAFKEALQANKKRFYNLNQCFDAGHEEDLSWRARVSVRWWRDERMKLSDLPCTLLHSDWRA